MRRVAVALSVILGCAAQAEAASLFASEFDGCSDGGTCAVDGWTTEVDTNSDMSASTTAGDFRVASCGCKNVLDDTTTAYVAEDTAFSTEGTVYGMVRFKVLADGTYPANQNVTLASGIAEAASPAVLILNMLTDADGDWSARTRYTTDAGTVTTAGNVYPLRSNRWYCWQFYYLKATSAGANDGIVESWIDGYNLGRVTGIDNDTRDFGEARLGDDGADATPAMTVVYDEVSFDNASLPSCDGLEIMPQAVSNEWEFSYQ